MGIIFGRNFWRTLCLSTKCLHAVSRTIHCPNLLGCFYLHFILRNNSFLFWNNKDKPNSKAKNLFLLIPLLVIFDGLFTVIIDLIMDPIQVHSGTWAWLDKGPYFGIPIGNFIGWFIVAVLTTGIYRTYEYFYPKTTDISKTTFMIPVIGYGALSIAMLFIALQNNLYPIAILSLLIMFPVPLINVAVFIYNRQH